MKSIIILSSLIIALTLSSSLVFAEESLPLNLKGVAIGNTIYLTWDEPITGLPIDEYHIFAQEYGCDSCNEDYYDNYSDTTSFVLKNLNYDMQHLIQVQAHNEMGWGNYTAQLSITTQSESIEEDIDCHTHDNRFKTFCMVENNEEEEYNNKKNTESIDLLHQIVIELQNQITVMYDEMELVEADVDQQRWYSGQLWNYKIHFLKDKPNMYDSTELGKSVYDPYQSFENRTVYFRSAIVQYPSITYTDIPNYDESSKIYLPIYQLPDWAKGHLTYTLEKPDGEFITNQYCDLEPGQIYDPDTCTVIIELQKGDILRGYSYLGFVGETPIPDNFDYDVSIAFQYSTQHSEFTTIPYIWRP